MGEVCKHCDEPWECHETVDGYRRCIFAWSTKEVTRPLPDAERIARKIADGVDANGWIVCSRKWFTDYLAARLREEGVAE